jgi:hypothetical protein
VSDSSDQPQTSRLASTYSMLRLKWSESKGRSCNPQTRFSPGKRDDEGESALADANAFSIVTQSTVVPCTVLYGSIPNVNGTPLPRARPFLSERNHRPTAREGTDNAIEVVV